MPTTINTARTEFHASQANQAGYRQRVTIIVEQTFYGTMKSSADKDAISAAKEAMKELTDTFARPKS